MCVCVCVCSAGNICMFRSNEALNVSMDQSPAELNKTLDNINTFLGAVPQVRETLLVLEVRVWAWKDTKVKGLGRSYSVSVTMLQPWMTLLSHDVLRLCHQRAVSESVHWLMTSAALCSVNTLISRYKRLGEGWRERQGCVLFVLVHLQKLLCMISSRNQSLTYLKPYLVCTLSYSLFFLCVSPASRLCGEWELQNCTACYQKPRWWERRTSND